jgi:peptidoglycan-associated lipoprotein
MKIKSLGLLFLVFVLVLSLGGCGCFRQAVKGEAPPPPPPAAPQVTAPEQKAEVPVPPPPPPPPAVGVALQSIYFDFDKYSIKPDAAESLKKNADWFKANAGKKVRVEGNCDERGTIEYNMVLGQKRADTAKAYLSNLGIDGKLMETISYGKERPSCMDKNEGCWSKNRRDDFKPLP